MKIKRYCIDCKKEISLGSKKSRCSLCSKLGTNNPNYKNRETYCIDCGEKVGFGRKRCRKCYNLFLRVYPELNPICKKGKYLLDYFCKDCGKQITKKAGIVGLGYCRKCVDKYKIYPDRTGEKNPAYLNGIWTANYYRCIDCKVLLSRKTKSERCTSCFQKERLKDPINHPMYGIHRYGQDAPGWKGGISFELYNGDFNTDLKNKIRFRDNYECQICHKKQYELSRYLDVHHINYNKQNCKEENLISLCPSCHVKTNGNREYWTIVFNNLLRIGKVVFISKKGE